jgi:hypothetical protein
MRCPNFIVLLIVCFFAGCAHKPFQPPSPASDNWIKKDGSRLESTKALLECGAPTPWSLFSNIAGKKVKTSNEVALIELCLLKDGFFHAEPTFFGVKLEKISPTSLYTTDHLMACQASAVPPTRSIERRLNSNYCKHRLYSTYEACK